RLIDATSPFLQSDGCPLPLGMPDRRWAPHADRGPILPPASRDEPPPPDGAPPRLPPKLDRMWWFLTGVVAGGLVTVRALRRRPRPHELKAAAAHTGADILGLAARAVRAPRR